MIRKLYEKITIDYDADYNHLTLSNWTLYESYPAYDSGTSLVKNTQDKTVEFYSKKRYLEGPNKGKEFFCETLEATKKMLRQKLAEFEDSFEFPD